MAFATNFRLLLESIIAIVASAVMLYFGNGLNPIWPLMWFALLPILSFALRSPWWAATAAAFSAMLFGSLNTWNYFTQTIGMPVTTWADIFIAGSIVFALAVLLFRALVLRGAVWSGLLAFPSAWVVNEYVRNLLSPHGTAGSLAYSQLKFLPFLQLASLTGPWGMSFVLLLFSAAVAVGIHLRQRSPMRALRVAATGTVTLATVLVFGAMRLSVPQTQLVKVGLITSDDKSYANIADAGRETERLFYDYVENARMLITNGAQVIVMPEKLGVTLHGQEAPTDAKLQTLTETGATVVAGVIEVDASTKYNEARIYTENSAVQTYDKEHMLPPFESNLKPGATLKLLPKARQIWGVAICKDMDFASPARLYGEAGVGLLLVPGWDFVVDGSWHGHMAIMRGVEDGFSIARSARSGLLTVSDNRGRVIGEVNSSVAPFTTLLVSVPAAHSWTLYQSLGDWFAWVSVGILIVTIFVTLRRNKLAIK